MIGDTDEAAYIISLLDTYWNTGVIAKPTIGKTTQYSTVDVANSNWILAYRVSRTAAQAHSLYDYQKVRAEVALDIRTRTRADMLSMLAEVRRILWAYRLSTEDPYDWINPIGVDYEDHTRRLHRVVYGVELHGIAAITTS